MLLLQAERQHGAAALGEMERGARDAGQAEADADMADEFGEVAGCGIQPRGLGGEAQQVAGRGVGIGFQCCEVDRDFRVELALAGLDHALEMRPAERASHLQGGKALEHGMAARAAFSRATAAGRS